MKAFASNLRCKMLTLKNNICKKQKQKTIVLNQQYLGWIHTVFVEHLQSPKAIKVLKTNQVNTYFRVHHVYSFYV